MTTTDYHCRYDGVTADGKKLSRDTEDKKTMDDAPAGSYAAGVDPKHMEPLLPKASKSHNCNW